MLPIVVLLSLLISITTAEQNITSRAFNPCVTNTDCNQGICDHNRTIATCVCNRGWTLALDGSNQCTYQQKSKLAAFLLSFFAGALGADWFYLSVGNGGYIAAGVFKLLTLGGIGIWWLVDWIRILTNSFLDGQGVGLLEWTP
jgi:TM2 domain-containing membrane protein YozV